MLLGWLIGWSQAPRASVASQSNSSSSAGSDTGCRQGPSAGQGISQQQCLWQWLTDAAQSLSSPSLLQGRPRASAGWLMSQLVAVAACYSLQLSDS